MEAKLNKFNYLNLAAFVISWALNSEVDMGPDQEFWSFLGGMRELGRRYESVVTPQETTFLIAHVALLFQGIFAVAQLLPKYRASSLVQDGVSYWFIASSISQLLWSFDFSLDNWFGALLSVGFMAVMVGCNGKILITQSSLTTEHQQPEEYWLLRFPFSLHTGWTMAVFVMSINGFFNAFGLPEFIQLILGFVSLAAFAGISWKMLLANGDEPNYAIPAIVAWVLLGVAFGEGPRGGMEDFLGAGFKVISGVVGFGIGGFTGYHFYTKEVVDSDFVNVNFKGGEKTAAGDETDYVAPKDGSIA